MNLQGTLGTYINPMRVTAILMVSAWHLLFFGDQS